jgi:osmotically-inducible protein OsmY
MRTALVAIAALVSQCGLWGQETSTFRTYVDTDVCARLMLGPITPSRIECSQKSAKDNNQPVLVRLQNNMVLTVNKEKMIKPLVGQFAEVSGELKVKNGAMKLKEARPIEAGSIPSGDPERQLLEPSRGQQADPQVWEKVRHELAMMPYISEFDFISFTMSGSNVILTGWTVRQTNRDYAYNVVKNVKGVETVINNIDILPLGSFDMQIRAAARAALQVNLSRYFWGSGSDIKIIVKNGQVILLGNVTSQGDSDIAFMRVNGLPNVFKVFNMLKVQSSTKKAANPAPASQTVRRRG